MKVGAAESAAVTEGGVPDLAKPMFPRFPFGLGRGTVLVSEEPRLGGVNR